MKPIFKECLKKRLLIIVVDNLWEREPIDECVIDIRSCSPRLILPFLWRECIKKIWEVDQLCCAKSGGEM